MAKKHTLLTKIRQALNVIPKEYYFEIQNKIMNSNIKRVRALSMLLIFLNVIMIVVDLTVYYPRWDLNSGYVNLFYSHIFIVIERSLYLFGVYLTQINKINIDYNEAKDVLHFYKRRVPISARGGGHISPATLKRPGRFFAKNTKNLSVKSCYKLKKTLVIYSCAIALTWFTYLSINAQSIHGQISAFIIGNLTIASTILMVPMQSLFIFVIDSSLFGTALYFTSRIHGNFASDAINILFVFALSFLLSQINIAMYSRDYINKKTIQLQARELAGSKDKLEEKVKTRTEELMNANEQLIKEMGIRHEVELQSIKTRLMYEENTMLLKEIKEYEELRNVFFANLSHELRTPLNVIFSAQQMMNFVISNQTCNDCKNQISKYNRIVKQNCYRLIRLIGNLIDITKIDAKYFEIKKKNCDIVNLVENIAQSVAEYIKDKDIELCFNTDIDKKIIACDPDKVERIMLNLLSNAVKFTPVKGQINVRMRQDQGYVVITVKDTGIGISREMQQAVFERFMQADKSMARNREGSGIGLSLVKSLVDLHQGRISLISEPGKGSEFVIELPDEAIPFEDYVACTHEVNGENIDRINIEFSDIYS